MDGSVKKVVPEKQWLYTDSSQQFVPFEESDSSVTPPVAVEESQMEEPSAEVDHITDSVCNPNCTGSKTEAKVEIDLSADASGTNTRESRRLRRRNVRREGNGLCPPHPRESLSVVKWTEPNEISSIFPKTSDYVVCAQARYSSQYLTLSKWQKEFDFFNDKYNYWSDIIQKEQLSNPKEVIKAKQLVEQLKWLLDHCWDGDESKPPVPEMLWRARKEETRRCEQLLIRKEYHKREAMGKKEATVSSTCKNRDAKWMTCSDEYGNGRNCSLKEKTRNSAMFSKKASSGKAGYASNIANVLNIPPQPICKIKKEQEKPDYDESVMSGKGGDQKARKNAYLFSLQFIARRWNDALKQLEKVDAVKSPAHPDVLRSRLEKYLKDLTAMYDMIRVSEDFDEPIIRNLLQRNALLKREMRDNGFESFTNSWVIFESKSPNDFKKADNKKQLSNEPSKSPDKFPSISSSTGLLKVRDYLDDDGKSSALATTKSGGEHDIKCSPKVAKMVEVKVKDPETQGTTVPSFAVGSSQALPVKPSLSEDERNRLELQEVVAVEALWARFAKAEAPKCDKQILNAISNVLSACKSYRAVLEVPLPKTVADIRRGAKLRCIQQAVALLQTLIIQRHEAKTGRPVDLTPFETPEIKRLRAQLIASNTVKESRFPVSEQKSEVASQASSSFAEKPFRNDDKQEGFVFPQKKKQKLQENINKEVKPRNNEQRKVSKSAKHNGGIEMLATSRPKRHIKAPNRFVFDDEEKEEEEKRKKVAYSHLKVDKASNLKPIKRSKEVPERNSGRKRKSESSTPLITHALQSPSDYKDLSDMEKIVVIPEEEITHEIDDICCSSNNKSELLLGSNVASVTMERKFQCAANDTGRNVHRCVTFCDSGTTKEVAEKTIIIAAKDATKDVNQSLNVNRETEKRSTGQHSLFDVVQQEQVPFSVDSALCSFDTSSSNEHVTNSGNTAPVSQNSANAHLLNTELSMSRSAGSKVQDESRDCNPWRQVAFRKEASLNEPPKMDKLKTQYDHLLMISEKKYLEKVRNEWIHVPEGGPFDDKVNHIRRILEELEDVLYQPTSTWKDYFNIKKYMQILIDNVMADFNSMSGQAAPTELPPHFNVTIPSSKISLSESGQENIDTTTRPNSN